MKTDPRRSALSPDKLYLRLYQTPVGVCTAEFLITPKFRVIEHPEPDCQTKPATSGIKVFTAGITPSMKAFDPPCSH